MALQAPNPYQFLLDQYPQHYRGGGGSGAPPGTAVRLPIEPGGYGDPNRDQAIFPPGSQLFDDEGFQQILNAFNDLFTRGEESRSTANASALDLLLGIETPGVFATGTRGKPGGQEATRPTRSGGLQQQISDLFSERQAGIESAIPVDPFTDEMVKLRTTIGNDVILGGLQESLGNKAIEQARLGGMGGGQTAGAGALLRSGAMSDQAKLAGGLQQFQDTFNLQSNNAREALLNQLTGQRGQLETRIGSLASAIQAGDVYDPVSAVSSLGDLFSANIAVEQGELERDLQERLAEGGWFQDASSGGANVALSMGYDTIAALLNMTPTAIEGFMNFLGGNR